MRICLLEGDMSRNGGTERMTALLANALSVNHQVWVISLQLQKNQVFFELDSAVCHHVLPTAHGKAGIFKHIRAIHSFLIEHQIQRVINVDVGMGFYGILSAKGTDAKVITWEHGNFFNNWGSRIFPYLRRYAARHSDAMVVLTQRDRENYSGHISRVAPIRVIPNPVESHNYEYDLSSKTILSIGHLNANKAYHRAVEVASKILPSHPEWRWLIYGDGPERQRLEAEIQAAGLEKQVLLPGTTRDLDHVYSSATCLVLTSDMEGLPMVLLEGKSWGLPLVAFDIMTGPSDIIEHGVNGYLVPPHDLDQMAEYLEALIGNEELRKRFSDHAVTDMERFAWENIIATWEALLKEV